MADELKWSKEDIDRFVRAVEKAERTRRIMLLGYLLAVVVLIAGQLGALYVYGTAPPGKFVGWVFLVPFAAVALILWGFGRWARVGK